MDGKKDWIDYANFGATVCTLLATVAISYFVQQAGDKADHAKNVASHFEACYDNQFKLDEALCHDNNCTPASATRLSQLAYFYGQVKQYCETKDPDLNIPVSDYLAGALENAVATAGKSTSVETRASAAQSFGAKSAAPDIVSAAHAPAQASQNNASADQYPPADPLLFVQISSADQKPAADALIRAVSGVPFMGGKLRALGPDPHYVPLSPTQLRCSKVSDCAHAKELALYLGSVLGGPVKVVDISARYGAAMARFGPRFELWIAPGKITVNSPGGSAGGDW